MQQKTLILSTLALLLFACDSKETPQQQKANNTQAATTPQNTATQQNSAATSPAEFTPSANDISNLAKAMGGGAAGIMPDDAPKDKYGKPYIIGNLGGVPVNLPPSVVELVEYNDSPGFNPEALRNFKPSVRNYDSIIKAFGFEFRNRDLTLYDRRSEWLHYIRKRDMEKRNGADWIDVGISAGGSYGKNPDSLTDLLNDYTGEGDLEPLVWRKLTRLSEDQFDLEVYAAMGIDPKTGKTWREADDDSEDVFIRRDATGKVQTYIRCSNRDVKRPPCRHYFKFPSHMKIRIRLGYSRHVLHNWLQYEENAIKLVNGFRVSNKEDSKQTGDNHE